MNSKLRDAVKRAGDQVIFVEWEDRIDTIDGRYCEPGGDETPGKGDDRETLAFYEWYSTLDDTAFGRNAVKSRADQLQDVFGDDITAANAPADQMGQYQARITRSIKDRLDEDDKLIGQLKEHNPELKGIDDTTSIASILSDKILRNFHPQYNAQQRIAAAVLTALEQVQAKELGEPGATTTAIGCEAGPTDASMSIESATPPGPTPEPDKPMTRDVDLGILNCHSENNDNKPGDAQNFMTLEGASTAIDAFCQSLRNNKYAFGPGGISSETRAIKGAVVSLSWEGGDNCPDPPDFSDDGPGDAAVDMCKSRLGNPIHLCNIPLLH